MDISRRAFMGGTIGAGAGLVFGVGAVAQTSEPSLPGKSLCHIDCTQEYPSEKYFGQGEVRVIESAAGRYREAEAKPLSRFGYRFQIQNVGRPHIAVVRYPDDKRRFMCINDGTGYDLTTGVLTGSEQPLSGSMLELRQVFWPRWQDCSIVFMTWGEGEPAAVASIDIVELDDLPALETPGDPGDGSFRELGIQYEDPCGCCASEGARTREEWIDHLVQYAKHTGQNLLAYPMAWYHGPQYPSAVEPADGFGMLIAADRRQYSRWTTQPEDWYAGLLDRFAKEGLAFQGALTLLRLGSLLEKMNIDLDAIKGGADTYNNMLWNNEVQSSTNDWTPIYNARNFNRIAEALKDKPPAEPGSILSEWLHGERRTPNAHTGPMFNPLHPTVREALIRFVREIGERYGKYPSFRGISFNMFASSMPWFGSIHSGYDDCSTALFEKETGIRVPVDPKSPDRFSLRYQYLVSTCRPAWVNWRCRKIRALFGELRGVLAASREDLRVTISLWDETTVTNVLGGASAALQLYARSNMLDFYRDAGIDLSLYRNERGLEVDRGMGNPRDRGGHGANPCGGTSLSIEEQTMYRDFDYLDQESLDAYAAHERPGAFIFNCWVEAWGKHVWFQPEPDDPNLAEAALLDGKPAEGILRLNSEYPADGFWWDSQLRITPPFPSEPHFLEPYAHAVAELDACRITRGGLFLDKAHTESLRGFAPAYRALPKKRFTAVGHSTDPVALRTLVDGETRYFYMVNREYYPVDAQVSFSDMPDALRDLATGQAVDAGPIWRIKVEPYQLRSFAMNPKVEVVSFSATPPAEIVQALTDSAKKTFEACRRLRAGGKTIPGMDEMESRIRGALAEARVAWLRRALSGYIVRRSLAEAGLM